MSHQNDADATGQQGGGQASTPNQQGGGQQQAGSGQQGAQQQGGQPASGQRRNGGGDSLTDKFAMGALRTGLVLVGFTLFLFALGQAVGLGLLDMFVSAVTSQTGRWLVVAAFALLLIVVGQQGVKHSSWTD